MGFLTATERVVVTAAAERLLPAGADPVLAPGATEARVVDYIELTLSAFDHDPPFIFCGGPWADRGGDSVNHYLARLPLGRLEELAWRIRIEGSQCLPEREFNGPVTGWQQTYRDGIAALGDDFAEVDGAEQDRRLAGVPTFSDLLFSHACEGMYAAPEYGGNPGMITWPAVGYAGDTLPRGWSDDEVSFPLGRPA